MVEKQFSREELEIMNCNQGVRCRLVDYKVVEKRET